MDIHVLKVIREICTVDTSAHKRDMDNLDTYVYVCIHTRTHTYVCICMCVMIMMKIMLMMIRITK